MYENTLSTRNFVVVGVHFYCIINAALMIRTVIGISDITTK